MKQLCEASAAGVLARGHSSGMEKFIVAHLELLEREKLAEEAQTQGYISSQLLENPGV